MKVKILNTDSEHTKDWIGEIGELSLERRAVIQVDSTGKFINTTAIKKITVQTKNTTYELEVID